MSDEQLSRSDFSKNAQKEKEQYYNVVSSNFSRMANNPELFLSFLNVQSHMSNFSVGNCMMLAIQCPGACKVKLSTVWNEHGVKPLKGTRGIAILVPTTKYKKADGSTAQGYDLRRVFDVMQTTAAEDYLKQGPPRIDYRQILHVLMEYQQGAWSFSVVDTGKPAEYIDSLKTINIRKKQTFECLFPYLLREIIIADLMMLSHKDLKECSPTATCVSYMFCHKYAISTDGLEIPLPEKIMGTDPNNYVSNLNQMVGEYRAILRFIEKALAVEVVK